MSARRLPVLFAAVLGLAGLAPAEPFTDLFQPLLGEMNFRDGDLPLEGLTREQKRQRSALRRAYRALDADSVDLAGDLKMAYKMTKALDAAYVGDPAIGGLLDDLNGALGALVLDGRDLLEVAIAGLADGKYKTKAAARLARADAIGLLVAGAPTRARRALYQRKCWAVVLQGNRLATKASPGGPSGDSSVAATVDGSAWQTNTAFGTAVTGLANVSTSSGGVRKVLFTGRRILPNSGNEDLPGATTRLQILLSASWADVETGTFTVGGAEGVSVSATWTSEDEAGDAVQSVAVAGTVTIATLETTAGSVSATGTFAFTMYDGVADVTFPVTAGTFAAYDLPRQDVP